MELSEDRGLKTVRYATNQQVIQRDVAYMGVSTYSNFTDMLAMLANVGVEDGTGPDRVVSGLLLEFSATLSSNLRAGAAISYTGEYYPYVADEPEWGFNADAGKPFSVMLPNDSVVTVDAMVSQPRYDTIEIRPVLISYDTELRAFRDPITTTQTSANTATRNAYEAEVQILKGIEGAGVAPTHTAGWIKVAEVYVAGATITQASIKDVRDSLTWTAEVSGTEYPTSNFNGEFIGNSGETFLRVADVSVDSIAGYQMENDAQNWYVKVNSDDNFYIENVTGSRIPVVIEPGALNNTLWLSDVGIGIGKDPTTKLDVDGTITASGLAMTGNIAMGNNDITGGNAATFTNLYGLVGTATQGTIDHDSLANYVADQHVAHSGVSISPGTGIDGGGDITVTRTITLETISAGGAAEGALWYHGVTKTIGQLDGGSTDPTNVTRLNYDGYLYATRLYGDLIGTILTAAQANITSLGTLTGLTMGGNIAMGSNDITGGGSATFTNLTGTLQTAAQPNITSLGTLTELTVDTIGAVDIDTDTGFTVDDDSGAYIHITATGDIAIYTAASQTLTLNAGDLDLDTTGGIAINDDSGGLITISAAGVITLTSPEDTNIVIGTSGNGQIQLTGGAEVDLTATLIDINGVLDHDGATFNVNTTDVGVTSVQINTAGGIDVDSAKGIVITETHTAATVGAGITITSDVNDASGTSGDIIIQTLATSGAYGNVLINASNPGAGTFGGIGINGAPNIAGLPGRMITIHGGTNYPGQLEFVTDQTGLNQTVGRISFTSTNLPTAKEQIAQIYAATDDAGYAIEGFQGGQLRFRVKQFNTTTPITRLLIRESGNLCIGNGLINSITDLGYYLQLKMATTPIAPCYIQWTSNSSGHTATDGVRIGFASGGTDFYITNREATNVYIQTAATTRITLSGTGAITTQSAGIGTIIDDTYISTGTGAGITIQSNVNNASGTAGDVTIKTLATSGTAGKVTITSANTAADSLKIDILGGLDIDVDNGWAMTENSGAYFNMSGAGSYSLLGGSAQNCTIGTSSNGKLTVNADGQLVLSTGQNATNSIRIDANSAGSGGLDIDAGAAIAIGAGTDIVLTANKVAINMLSGAAGKLSVRVDDAAAIPVVHLEQLDAGEEFIRFEGGAINLSLTSTIVEEAAVTTATRQGFLRVYVIDINDQITDQAYYMPIFTLA